MRRCRGISPRTMPDGRCYITGMAADISEITLCNQPEILSADDAHDLLIHILIDLHDALKMLADQGRLLARHDAMLAEYRPLLDRYAHPLAAKLTRRPRG